LIVAFSFNDNYLIAFVIVILHEYTHYFTAYIFGYRGGKIRILPFGASLNLTGIEGASVKEEIIISLSGPIMNLVLAVIFYALNINYRNGFIETLFFTNLCIGIFNLLPALPLDGGRILRAIISSRTVYRRANIITIIVSMSIGGLFILYYLFCFFKGHMNFTFGIIAFYIIIYSKKEKERVAYIIMSDIIKKKFKFMKKGYIENKSLSIYWREGLLKALSLVEKNRYNLFIVLDDDLKVVDIIYESEVIDGLKNYGNISLDEYIKSKNSGIG
jgi:stage IV sporulation protein FB